MKADGTQKAGRMKRLLLGVGPAALLSLGAAAAASADPFVGPPICPSAGTPISGTYGDTVVTGNRDVAAGTSLTVIGHLTLAPGACLDAFTLGTVHDTGDVLAQRDSILGLGCTPGSIGPGPPCVGHTTNDIVGGDVTGNHPLTMYLDGDTIYGALTQLPDQGQGSAVGRLRRPAEHRRRPEGRAVGPAVTG